MGKLLDLLKRGVSDRKFRDAILEELDRLSGSQIPRKLREKWKEEDEEAKRYRLYGY
jgi:hypothetical protein